MVYQSRRAAFRELLRRQPMMGFWIGLLEAIGLICFPRWSEVMRQEALAAPDLLAMRREAMARGMIGAATSKAR